MTARSSGPTAGAFQKFAAAGFDLGRLSKFLEYLQAASARGDRADDGQLASLDMARTPHEVLYEEGSCRLLAYDVLGQRVDAPPILMLYSFINRWYILDLQPGHSFIEALSRAGFAVYMLDWGIPGPEHADRDLAYYLETVALRAVKRIRRRESNAPVSLFGYCLGGTLAAMMAALRPEEYAALVMLTTPLEFQDAGLLSLWTNREFFKPEKLSDAFGLIPEKVLHMGFPYMKPRDHLSRNRTLYEKITDDEYVKSFRSIERWSTDNVPFPGRVYTQFVKGCYQEDQLAKGEMRVGDRPVDLARIRCPALNIYAKNDHIVPPGTARRNARLLAGTRTVDREYDAAHISVTVASPIRERVWSETARWLRDNTGGAAR